MIDEIFVREHTGPIEVKRLREDECVAYFAACGRTDQEQIIQTACETLASFFRVPKDNLVSPGSANIVRPTGYTKTKRAEGHYRDIKTWGLADREAALRWLAEHPEPMATDQGKGVQS